MAKSKKWALWLLAGAATLAVIVAAMLLLGRENMVGRISGPEWNYLEMDGVSYVRRDSTPYGIQDKGKFLGLATDGVQEFCLYAVKGDEEGRYIYCFWDWEGFFYEKE